MGLGHQKKQVETLTPEFTMSYSSQIPWRERDGARSGRGSLAPRPLLCCHGEMWPLLLWGMICIFFFGAHERSHCCLTGEESRFATKRAKQWTRWNEVQEGTPGNSSIPKTPIFEPLQCCMYLEKWRPLWSKGLTPHSPLRLYPLPFSTLPCAPGGWTSGDDINQALSPFGFLLLSANRRPWGKAYSWR